jgi:hypothetical protein
MCESNFEFVRPTYKFHIFNNEFTKKMCKKMTQNTSYLLKSINILFVMRVCMVWSIHDRVCLIKNKGSIKY